MFCAAVGRMLASMSEIDPRAGELGVSGLLPTGTVTLLLADVEGSTRLWETQPEEMTAAIARLNQVVSQTIAAHDGVRPVEQGEGDSFVAAFARASDAVAAALELQRAPLAPIRSVKDSVTTTSPQGFSCHRAPCNPTSPSSTPSSGWPRACSSPKKQPATPER